ncbi:hypothetical protein MNBD_GAMMA12-3016 [hydrothermal vent metagenome]|uniref:Uncharacterized protein n=1 Tax=hydrothermal vent metagenome TaxID=652676 RepID=A0A3B0YCX2_9ZZZZ
MKATISVVTRISGMTIISLASLFSNLANSHPHPQSGQCQLPNGTWVMCNRTKHSKKTKQHIKINSRVKTLTLQQRRGKPGQRIIRVRKSRVQPFNRAKKLSAPFYANCASGFSKVGQNKFPNGTMRWYVCGTPVIQCPSYMQSNGKWANVTPKVVIQMIGSNPDGGTQKFRVQYKCDYSFNAVPAG